MRMDFRGKTLFITAGASGMGRCFAEYAAGRGAHVAIADIDEAGAKALAASLPSAIGIGCDVGNSGQVDAARDRALEAFGAVDMVMSHAGITFPGPMEAATDEQWATILNLNVAGMGRVLRAFLPHLIERRSGHVILTSSSLALIGGHPLSALAAPYVATKAAVIGLAQAAAVALAPHGVGVTLFAPDVTDTGFARPPAGAPPRPASLPAGVAPIVKQRPEQAVAALIDALEQGRFLASATPDHERLLRHQADVLLDPLRMAPSVALN